MFNFVVFGKFPTTQVVCEIGSCTIHWKVQLRTGLILTDKKFCEDRALDFPLLFTLHPHPLGVRLLLPCVSPPVLSIAAPKLGSPVSVHTRLTVLATARCCRPRLAQCCLVVGNLSMMASYIVTSIHPHVLGYHHKKKSVKMTYVAWGSLRLLKKLLPQNTGFGGQLHNTEHIRGRKMQDPV